MRLLLLLAGLGAFLTACGAGYDIADQEVKLVIHPDTNRVDVAFDLTYRLEAAVKTEGFKYVGTARVENLVCTDDQGRSLDTEILSERETKLVWHFPRQVRGVYTIKARFTLVDALVQRGAAMVFDAPWMGVFQVPVAHARWQVQVAGGGFSHLAALPFASAPVSLAPEAIQVYEQTPLTQTHLKLLFGNEPAVTRLVEVLREATAAPGTTVPSPGLGLLLGAAVLLVVGLVWYANRNRKAGVYRGLDGGTTSSTGGCGGASCGGGGGCGGGCGG